jgi:hypothetical protein
VDISGSAQLLNTLPGIITALKPVKVAKTPKPTPGMDFGPLLWIGLAAGAVVLAVVLLRR